MKTVDDILKERLLPLVWARINFPNAVYTHRYEADALTGGRYKILKYTNTRWFVLFKETPIGLIEFSSLEKAKVFANKHHAENAAPFIRRFFNFFKEDKK